MSTLNNESVSQQTDMMKRYSKPHFRTESESQMEISLFNESALFRNTCNKNL